MKQWEEQTFVASVVFKDLSLSFDLGCWYNLKDLKVWIDEIKLFKEIK